MEVTGMQQLHKELRPKRAAMQANSRVGHHKVGSLVFSHVAENEQLEPNRQTTSGLHVGTVGGLGTHGYSLPANGRHDDTPISYPR
jgi:hypothetical protein